MIKSIHVTNYRALRDVTCTLERFTVIVGPNGCGKSTLLEVLERTTTLVGDGVVRNPWGDDIEPGAAASLVLAAPDPDTVWSRTWEMGREDQARGQIRSGWKSTDHSLDFLDSNYHPEMPTVAPVRFNQAALRASSALNDHIEVISEDGRGMPGLFADWKLEDDPRLDTVLSQIRTVVPQVRSVLPRRTKNTYELFLGVGPEARIVSTRHASSGTLYALGLLTLLQSLGGRSALVLIDDIDQDLHPVAQAELVAVLRKVLEVNPELQIVATSHSPYFIDHMKAEEVRLMTLDDQAFSHVAKLTDHPEYERWRGMMMPGEFWSSIGEDWIVNPTAPASTGAG